jgi:predicted nuclease of predicted toxin-antitoxin system
MLLLDENLPTRLARDLAKAFPGSTTVLDLGMTGRSDRELAEVAVERGYVIVTKDRDFPNYAALRKDTLKVVWVRTGNCTPDSLRIVLQEGADLIRLLIGSEEHRILVLPPGVFG